jgi:putative transposase
MARLPRLSVAGLPHHLIQRGNNRQAVFLSDDDLQQYRAQLAELGPLHGVDIHAYVLMPNHVHLLVTPVTAQACSRFMQALGRRYVAWFNRKHSRTGTLWEGRFRSTVIESERYLLACSRYIELNPVRAGLVADPMSYPWSSHAHHAGLKVDPLITDHELLWQLGNTPFERQRAYAALFESRMTDEEIAAFRYSTQKGWALGSASFLGDLERSVVRRTVPARRGRPRKTTKSVPN